MDQYQHTQTACHTWHQTQGGWQPLESLKASSRCCFSEEHPNRVKLMSNAIRDATLWWLYSKSCQACGQTTNPSKVPVLVQFLCMSHYLLFSEQITRAKSCHHLNPCYFNWYLEELNPPAEQWELILSNLSSFTWLRHNCHCLHGVTWMNGSHSSATQQPKTLMLKHGLL